MEPLVRKLSLPFAVAEAATLHAARRRITPDAGRALEKLGHAIEYLTDEMVHRRDALSPGAPDMQAVQILMALNRSIYDECPLRASFVDRCRNFLHRLVG